MEERAQHVQRPWGRTCLVCLKNSEDTSVPGLEWTGPLGDEVRGPVWRDTSYGVLEASNDFGFSLNEMPLKGLNKEER